ncbi:hypothetical protein GJ496_008158 [Pomphorhynchus laevis]|nr:hypothetical protein GJ496_008158 [Pomphorhynchus laevis]
MYSANLTYPSIFKSLINHVLSLQSDLDHWINLFSNGFPALPKKTLNPYPVFVEELNFKDITTNSKFLKSKQGKVTITHNSIIGGNACSWLHLT